MTIKIDSDVRENMRGIILKLAKPVPIRIHCGEAQELNANQINRRRIKLYEQADSIVLPVDRNKLIAQIAMEEEIL